MFGTSSGIGVKFACDCFSDLGNDDTVITSVRLHFPNQRSSCA